MQIWRGLDRRKRYGEKNKFPFSVLSSIYFISFGHIINKNIY